MDTRSLRVGWAFQNGCRGLGGEEEAEGWSEVAGEWGVERERFAVGDHRGGGCGAGALMMVVMLVIRRGAGAVVVMVRGIFRVGMAVGTARGGWAVVAGMGIGVIQDEFGAGVGRVAGHFERTCQCVGQRQAEQHGQEEK